MKMRKCFVMALVALGATAAFSSCQKDDKTYSDPKIEFRDANNKVITEFTKENAEIKVLVTLGDPSLKIKKCEAKVLKADGVVNPDLKLNFKPVSGGADDGKFEAKFTFADTKIVGGEKNPVEVKVEVTDSKNKLTRGELKYKANGGAETPAAAVEMKGWVNNNLGKADGGFSFIVKKSVKSDDKTADLVNDSEAGKGIAGKLKSNTGLQFSHVESAEVDYSKATKELVAKAAVGKTFAATIDGLKANSLFIAKDKTGTTFYLFKVTEIGANDKDYNGKEAVPTTSTSGNGGYMIFGYKSNK